MSYKTEFASNNTDLQTILDKVNALPDAGGYTPPYEQGVAYVLSGTKYVFAPGSTVSLKTSASSFMFLPMIPTANIKVTDRLGNVLTATYSETNRAYSVAAGDANIYLDDALYCTVALILD